MAEEVNRLRIWQGEPIRNLSRTPARVGKIGRTARIFNSIPKCG